MVRWLWWLWWLALAAGASPAEDRCVASESSELEYSCADDQYTIKGKRFQYVDIECQNVQLNCSTFPSKWFSNGTVGNVSLKGCAVRGPLACLLAKLGVADAHRLLLYRFRTPLTEALFSGLRAPAALAAFDTRGASVQTEIPYDVMSSLPRLSEFRLSRARVALRPGRFQAPLLKFLELSSDSISQVPPGAFEGLPALESLQLWGNQISELHNHSFAGLPNLKSLALNKNRLSSLSGGALEAVPSLQTFGGLENPLSRVRDGFFTGHQRLETIQISSSEPLELDPRAFSDLESLQRLILESCHLQHLPGTVFSGSVSIRTLSLKDNRLESLDPGVFGDQAELVELDLSRNKLKALEGDLFITLSKLTALNLNYNLLEIFPDNLFSGLTSLQTLSASNNRLKQIEDMAFQGAPLRTLDLANNRLSFSSPPNVSYYGVLCPFNGLLHLRRLNLSRNLVEEICDLWRLSMIKLEVLDLSYNRISELDYADFSFVGSNVAVNLTKNAVGTVILVPNLWSSINSFATFILDENPFDCDCRIHSFLEIATSRHYSKYFSLRGAKCSSPFRLNGTSIARLPLDELVCDVPCSRHCDCIEVPNKNVVEAECSGIDSAPSNITERVALKFTKAPKSLKYLAFENVVELDLSGLSLSQIDTGGVADTVKFLNLSNNELRYIPSDFLYKNLSFALSDNPLGCDCWDSKKIAELRRFKHKIVDYKSLKCEDGTLLSLVDVQRLCSVYTAAYISTGVIALGIFLFLLATVFIYKYSFEVKIYASKYLPCLLPEEKYDASKKYDAFVSYAHQDEDFVRDVLLPKLEGPPINVKTCVHSRDWTVGETIPYNITKSVEDSRRTVIVLSENFLKSIWGLLEFRAAHVQATKEGRTRVIVILLEDVTDRKELDREISAYLHTNTYIKWGDPWFWDKLAYALPRAGKVVDRGDERRLQSAAKKLVEAGLDVHLNDRGNLVNAAYVKDV